MTGTNRQMRLTPEVVAMVPPHDGESGKLAGRSDLNSDDNLARIRADLMAGAPASGEVWIFAYGSLIWRPEFDFVEERLATVSGWHRSFCLGSFSSPRSDPQLGPWNQGGPAMASLSARIASASTGSPCVTSTRSTSRLSSGSKVGRRRD